MSDAYTQQVIVPAYVWNDPKQRAAVSITITVTLAQTIDRDGRQPVGDIIDDADLDVTHLKAQVGEKAGTSFVAYQPCPETDADLVFIHATIGTTSKGAT